MSPKVKRRVLSILAAGAVKWTLWAIFGWFLDDVVGLTTPWAWGIATGIGMAVGLYMLYKLWNYKPASERELERREALRIAGTQAAGSKGPAGDASVLNSPRMMPPLSKESA